jgi:integrase
MNSVPFSLMQRLVSIWCCGFSPSVACGRPKSWCCALKTSRVRNSESTRLAREIEGWIAGHPERDDPRAFLFPSSAGTAFSVGNYLKRYLKPLGRKAGIDNLTHQAFRRTSSTHMQNHATVKDMQRHLRHTDPQTTLKYYAKVIPESLRSAVAALDAQITGAPVASK